MRTTATSSLTPPVVVFVLVLVLVFVSVVVASVFVAVVCAQQVAAAATHTSPSSFAVANFASTSTCFGFPAKIAMDSSSSHSSLLSLSSLAAAEMTHALPLLRCSLSSTETDRRLRTRPRRLLSLLRRRVRPWTQQATTVPLAFSVPTTSTRPTTTGAKTATNPSRLTMSPVTTIVPKKETAIMPPGSVLIVDVENVRGKTGFEMSHAELIHRLSLWMALNDNDDDNDNDDNDIEDDITLPQPKISQRGRVVLAVDHGHAPDAFWLPSRGMAVVFSGPRKADDVIAAEAIPFLLLHDDFTGNVNYRDEYFEADDESGIVAEAGVGLEKGQGEESGSDWGQTKRKGIVTTVVVCTGDTELCHRCRSAAVRMAEKNIKERGRHGGPGSVQHGKGMSSGASTVRIVQPAKLLNELESLEMTMDWKWMGGTLPTVAMKKDESYRLEYESDGESCTDILIVEDENAEALRCEIGRVESSMREQRSPKKRRKHLRQLRVLRERLARMYHDSSAAAAAAAAYSSSSTALSLPGGNDGFLSMSRYEHAAALERWTMGRDRTGRKRAESTADREVMAEALRREMMMMMVTKTMHLPNAMHVDGSGEDKEENKRKSRKGGVVGAAISPAEAFALHVRSKQ